VAALQPPTSSGSKLWNACALSVCLEARHGVLRGTARESFPGNPPPVRPSRAALADSSLGPVPSPLSEDPRTVQQEVPRRAAVQRPTLLELVAQSCGTLVSPWFQPLHESWPPLQGTLFASEVQGRYT
jgi:hypothetical protein